MHCQCTQKRSGTCTAGTHVLMLLHLASAREWGNQSFLHDLSLQTDTTSGVKPCITLTRLEGQTQQHLCQSNACKIARTVVSMQCCRFFPYTCGSCTLIRVDCSAPPEVTSAEPVAIVRTACGRAIVVRRWRVPVGAAITAWTVPTAAIIVWITPTAAIVD